MDRSFPAEGFAARERAAEISSPRCSSGRAVYKTSLPVYVPLRAPGDVRRFFRARASLSGSSRSPSYAPQLWDANVAVGLARPSRTQALQLAAESERGIHARS